MAATIARWNSISALRQEWVNSLRTEISAFFHKVDRFGAIVAQKPTSQSDLAEMRMRRDEAMASYRQIVLRLNFKEANHRKLDLALMNVMDLKDKIDDAKMVSALIASRRVLKEEWERTKFGPFLNVSRSLKRWARNRNLRKKLKKRGNKTPLHRLHE